MLGTVLFAAAALALAWQAQPEQPMRMTAGDAGGVMLVNSKEGAAVLVARKLVPGETRSGTVTLTNAGEEPGDVTLAESALEDTPGPGGGVLSGQLVLRVTDLTTDSVVFEGPLAAMSPQELAPFAPGESRNFRFAVTLPESSNAFQGSATSVTFDWTGTPAGELPPPPSSRYPAQVEFDQPLAWYRLGGAAGSAAMTDATGRHDGELKNSAAPGAQGALADRSDTATTFNGRASYGYANGIAAPAGGLTLEGWAKPAGRGGGTIAEHGTNAAILLEPEAFVFTTSDATVRYERAPEPGRWYHVAGTWDADTKLASLYVDGVLRAQARSERPPSGSPAFHVGYGQKAPWLDGVIDEVALYARALDSDRLLAHVNAAALGAPVTPAPVPVPVQGEPAAPAGSTGGAAAPTQGGSAQPGTAPPQTTHTDAKPTKYPSSCRKAKAKVKKKKGKKVKRASCVKKKKKTKRRKRSAR